MIDVTAIVLTYNRAHSLNQVIQSLVHQTLSNFQLIIADDASPDSTPSLCAKWSTLDSRIVYQRRKENVGMPQNLNLALQKAEGQFIAILHDDDAYDPDLLSTWKDALANNPNAAFVFNAYAVLGPDGTPETVCREHLPACINGSKLIEDVFFRRWRFDSPVFGTVMMRRRALATVGPFNEQFGFWADVDMWLRMAEHFDVAYIDRPLIGIMSRESAPHQFADGFYIQQRIVEKAFLEARIRHFRSKPLRLTAELMRHYAHVCGARSRHSAGVFYRKADHFCSTHFRRLSRM